MTCNIIPPATVKMNGSNGAYGGKLTALTLNFGPIGSEQKASATLVGASMSTPPEGDDMLIQIGGSSFKMRVGGFSMSSSGGGATTMTLDLRDTSAKYLDNNFILLAEQAGAEQGASSTAKNIDFKGGKVGPQPDASLKENQIYTANRDTEWGNVRGFYEANSAPRADEDNEDFQARVDSLVRSNPGKVLWGSPVGGGPIPSSLLKGAAPVPGSFDFKGSYREVLVSYCKATNTVAWWDMQEEKVEIQYKRNVQVGLAKLGQIKESCEIIASSQSVDYTTTVATGAEGSFSINEPGENTSMQGLKMSRFLPATPLRPEFKYKNCKDKGKAGGLVKLELTDSNVLKAFQASVDPKIYAAYAVQSCIDAGGGRAQMIAAMAASAPSLEITAVGKTPPTETITIDYDSILQKGDEVGTGGNEFLKNYYAFENGRPCSNGYTPVRLGNQGEDITTLKQANALATVGETNPKQFKGANEEKKAVGWNLDNAEEPFSVMGKFTADGQFENGSMIAGVPGYLDSVLGEKGFTGENDILRMYLMAIYKFSNRFWVIRANGIDPRTNYRTTAFSFKGRDYGYYLTSSATGANMSLTPPDGYKLISVNPLAPVGACGVPELQALAQTLALMYLAPGKSLSSVTGNDKGESGVAVIDFVASLDSDSVGEKDPSIVGPTVDPPTNNGLEALFNGNPSGGQPPIRRGENVDDPEIMMHLLCLDSPVSDLAATPQISFIANDAGREGDNQAGGNQGEFQGESMMNGPTKRYAEEALTTLSDIKGLQPLKSVDKSALRLFGLQTKTIPGGSELNLHGKIPADYMEGGLGPTGDFISPAVLQPQGDDRVKVWYDVEGAMNQFDQPPAGVSVGGVEPPPGNCWTSKMNFGLSVNAADVGGGNSLDQGWEASPERPGNKYSANNIAKMTAALNEKLSLSSGADRSFGISESLTFLVNEESNQFAIPSIADGVESFGVSMNGGRLEISLTVGGKTFDRGIKSMMGRLVQSPRNQYRPSSLVPDSYEESVNPRFKQAMRNS